MLTDDEIRVLRTDPDYLPAVSAGLDAVVADLVRAGDADLRTDIASVAGLLFRFTRLRVIRRELSQACCDLLERLLNRELQWPRTPQGVHEICAAQHGALWMRYDVPRIKALLGRTRHLLSDAGMRALLKTHSSLPEPAKNDRLRSLVSDLELLERTTVRSIYTRGLFDHVVDVTAEEFYRSHESELQRRFLDSTHGGLLGSPSAPWNRGSLE